MDSRQRKLLLILTGLSVLVVLAQAVTGVAELSLYLTPAFLIAALLLSGYYVAEDRIVALRDSRPRRIRPTAARVRITRELPLASLLERSPLTRRGPPAGALLLA